MNLRVTFFTTTTKIDAFFRATYPQQWPTLLSLKAEMKVRNVKIPPTGNKSNNHCVRIKKLSHRNSTAPKQIVKKININLFHGNNKTGIQSLLQLQSKMSDQQISKHEMKSQTGLGPPHLCWPLGSCSIRTHKDCNTFHQAAEHIHPHLHDFFWFF